MTPSSLTWLHLSDFHTGKDEYAQAVTFKRILDEVASAKDMDHGKPDFVFITGDIANKGKAEEFATFDEQFIVPLLKILGDEYFDRILIIPGNHDIDRNQARSSKRFEVLEDIPTFLDPTDDAREERDFLTLRLKAFDQHKWYLNHAPWVTSRNGYSATKFSTKDTRVGILLINTAWFCGGDEDYRKITPGIEMVEEGINSLPDCDLIIVLGHHPIDWFYQGHVKRFVSILTKAGAVYLHGHLHKTESLLHSRGAGALLTLQAGCAFVARNEEKWLTRLLWANYDKINHLVCVRPKKFNLDDDEWILDPDAFQEGLRVKGSDYWSIPTRQNSPAARKATISEEKFSPPDGWTVLDQKFLSDHRKPISDSRLLQYFEGRIPEWEDILSNRIASRSIVSDLTSIIHKGFESGETQLCLLLGAGGEGKSTAFFQALERISSDQKINILWRRHPEKPLPSSVVHKMAASGEKWVFAADEGDNLAHEIYGALSGMSRSSKIQFFLTCRDTDWIEKRGNSIPWNLAISLVERRMKGLEDEDARDIIASWSRLGAQGLGKLNGLDEEEAVARLLDAAREESATEDGAFLGAMLRVRIGVALRDHVAALMARLENREIRNYPGKTLLDAFCNIAIPHAQNILFLSKGVLAASLGIDETHIRRLVLGPLGDEAAASVSSQFILTRHRAIAECAAEIAATNYEIDSEDLLISLVQSALRVAENGGAVPHLHEWRYLSSRVFESGNHALGVSLAKAALMTDPSNSRLRVKLAQLYREIGQSDQSASVFRASSVSQHRGNRAFYTEWAVCEGTLGNQGSSVWLNALSIADNTDMRPPDVKDCGYSFAGLMVNFVRLYERYQNHSYLKAAAACDVLVRQISLPKSIFEEFEERRRELDDLGADTPRVQDSLAVLVKGIEDAFEQREVEFDTSLPTPNALSFDGLRRTLRLRRL